MRFAQIDRILSLEPGKSITAVKGLALSEEYLKDHFPRFPVMPGVLMLESIFQASMYLVRVTEDFRHSMVVLKESRNFRFNGFVQPGHQLVVNATIQSETDNITKLKTEGLIDGKPSVGGVLFLERFNLADRDMAAEATDNHMRNQFRINYARLLDQLNTA
ncbi:MAG: beta-hydroxyacyl-ACP dehydratase [Pirellulaceae bacterium]|nr:beta-hydroxyacyl-ACP dehydratase [Pirellulaceae bacterium]